MSDSPTLAPLLQTFFTEHLLLHRQASPRTIAAYRDAFRLLLRHLHHATGAEPCRLTIADLDAPAILRFLDDLEQRRHSGARTRNARLAAVRSFFRFVAFREPAAAAVAGRVLAIPQKRTARLLVGHLTREEMDAILSAPDQSLWRGRRDHALLLTLYNTGARVSEITALRRADVVFGGGAHLQLHGKGRKQRSVPLWRKTARVLESWFRQLDGRGGGIAFPNARGLPLSRHGVRYLLREAARQALPRCPSLANRRISPHIVRHTTAVHLLQSGVDLAVIALWLGHESVETTHVYLEADLETKRRALAKLDPAATKVRAFHPGDELLAFLDGL